MKQYKAIFFDWDGTAVESRRADASRVVAAMERVLRGGTRLAVVSGTTYDNLCGGKLGELLTPAARQNLFLGLARGAYDYGYAPDGQLRVLTDATPDADMTLRLHDTVYAIHRLLLQRSRYRTDVVFSRPNYCKLDLMVENARADGNLFLQGDEVERINAALAEHSVEGGLRGLLSLAEGMGADAGLRLRATTDAKFLEVGFTTKSDNVDRLLDTLGLDAADCCFWGDEFGAIAPGIWGSDAQMMTDRSRGGAFFSVSRLGLPLPQGVGDLGGGIETFVSFLEAYGA